MNGVFDVAGRGVFKFAFFFAEEDPRLSGWFMLFYGAVAFFAVTKVPGQDVRLMKSNN